jgi:hypothetical protein
MYAHQKFEIPNMAPNNVTTIRTVNRDDKLSGQKPSGTDVMDTFELFPLFIRLGFLVKINGVSDDH